MTEFLHLPKRAPDIEKLLDAIDDYMEVTERFVAGNSDVKDAFIKLIGTSIAFRSFE